MSDTRKAIFNMTLATTTRRSFSSILTFTTSTASASLVVKRLVAGTTSTGAIGPAGTDLTARAGSLGLGGARRAIG